MGETLMWCWTWAFHCKSQAGVPWVKSSPCRSLACGADEAVIEEAIIVKTDEAEFSKWLWRETHPSLRGKSWAPETHREARRRLMEGWGKSEVTLTHRWMKWFSSKYWQPQAMSRATRRRSSMAREEGWFWGETEPPLTKSSCGEKIWNSSFKHPQGGLTQHAVLWGLHPGCTVAITGCL